MSEVFITGTPQNNNDVNRSNRQSLSIAQMGIQQNMHQTSAIQEIKEEQLTKEQFGRQLLKQVKKLNKFINPSSPRTNESMLKLRIDIKDLEIHTQQDISKALCYQIDRDRFIQIQKGNQIDDDIDIHELIYQNYIDHLNQLKDSYKKIIQERRQIINEQNDELFQKTHGGEGGFFFDRRQIKSSIGDRIQQNSTMASLGFDHRRQKIETRQMRTREQKIREVDKQVEKELMQIKLQEEKQLKEEEKLKKKQKEQKLLQKARSTKQLDKKIKQIKEDREEQQKIAFSKSSQFMSNLNQKFDSIMQKKEQERLLQKQKFQSDDRSQKIQENIQLTRHEQEQRRIDLLYKIESDIENGEDRRQRYLYDTIMQHQESNMEKISKIEASIQFQRSRDQLRLENYLKTQEQKIKLKEKIEKEEKLKAKKLNLAKKNEKERLQYNMETVKEKEQQKREKILERVQTKEEKFRKTMEENQRQFQNQRQEISMTRDIQKRLQEKQQMVKEEQIQYLQNKQLRAQQKIQKIQEEQKNLIQLSIQQSLYSTRDFKQYDQKLGQLVKSVTNGDKKPIIKTLKQLGELTENDQNKYKKFFPVEKKKPENDDL